MVTDLQKASLWKRVSAGLFDIILLAVLAVGAAALLSAVLGYNSHSDKLNEAYSRYEAEYGIQFDITQDDYNALPQAQKEAWDTAYQALTKDKEVLRQYNLVINLTLLITTFGILISVMALEFVVPLLLKNGQTLGKKIFGVAVMRSDGVKLSAVQLFIRTVLGKFTLEIMIPVYVIIMLLFNSVGIMGLAVLAAILIGEIVSMLISRTNALLHDSISATVAVDMATQMIFDTPEEKIAYIKRLHAEQSARQEY